MRRKYRERSLPSASDIQESVYSLLINFTYSMEIINKFLGVPPSRKGNMKSYLLDNAEPIDRTYQSYSTNNTLEAERQLPDVSTKPTSTWEPPRNIFSDL